MKNYYSGQGGCSCALLAPRFRPNLDCHPEDARGSVSDRARRTDPGAAIRANERRFSRRFGCPTRAGLARAGHPPAGRLGGVSREGQPPPSDQAVFRDSKQRVASVNLDVLMWLRETSVCMNFPGQRTRHIYAIGLLFCAALPATNLFAKDDACANPKASRVGLMVKTFGGG